MLRSVSPTTTVASAKSIDALDQIQIEMIAVLVFYPIQQNASSKLPSLKLKAKPLNLKKIEANAQGVRILFGEQPRINTPKLISLIQEQPQFYSTSRARGPNVTSYPLRAQNFASMPSAA
ncbi:hypothetical protein [Ignatzschineria indica]|uniref:hypothetical protein n=1 Tax=Ignatzschineria indica TaxID=472583 RepID=UPI00363A75FD